MDNAQGMKYLSRLDRATHNCEFVEAQHVHHTHLHSHWSDISAMHAIVLHNAVAVCASGSLQNHAVSGPLTWASTAANSSGRWLAHAATSRPPFDPPCSTRHCLHGQQHPQEDLAISHLVGAQVWHVATACSSRASRRETPSCAYPCAAYLVTHYVQ